MNSAEKILEELGNKPFSIKSWFKDHIIGVLTTLIFHAFLLILFLLFKIQSFKEQKDLAVMLDYTEPMQEEQLPDKSILTPSEMAYLERLLQQSNRSNQASNLAENLEKEISTKNYIEQVEEEMNMERSEEWKKLQEELEKKRSQEDFVPEVNKKPEKDETSGFKGLTNITYEFLESPVSRGKTYMPVPVYKCLGEGSVLVDITVDQGGRVTSARAFTQDNFQDMECMMEVAEKYAALSRFQGNFNAPKSHKARITYKFIAQ